MDDQGTRLPYPFSLPTPHQLLQSAFGEEYALQELGSGATSPSAVSHTSGVVSNYLRWVPFGLSRKLLGSSEMGLDSNLQSGANAFNASYFQDNEQIFLNALSQQLPQRWLKAPDG